MDVMIHCPACNARLNVLKKAAGHSVRCPRCKKPFKVPLDDREIVEDTITCWLEMDTEQERAEKEAAANPRPIDPAVFGSSPLPTPEDLPEYISAPDLLDVEAPASRVAAPSAADMQEAEEAGDTEKVGTAAAVMVQTEVEPPDFTERRESAASYRAPLSPMDEDGIDRALESAIEEYAAEGNEPAAPTRPAAKAEHKPITARRRPERQVKTPGERGKGAGRAVELRVLEMHPSGVLLGFDAQLLDLPAFRAALPMWCLACEQKEQTKLIARPLIWNDRLNRQDMGPEEVEAYYSIPVRAHQTGRDVLDTMREIDGMARPFNHPIPYYICEACSPKWHVHCHTATEKGGVLCEAMIPSGPYALAWLGRVNGVCGEEYEELEAHVAQTSQDDAWQAVPDLVRQRLGAWFDYGSGERFQVYLKDSDYPKADAGLGGLVLTDKRLVFCKYHRHGALKLEDPGIKLVATRNGPFDDLACEREDGSKSKLVRLRPDDTAQLIRHLEELGSPLPVERA